MIAQAFLDAHYRVTAATHLPVETPRGELIGTIVFLIILAIADLSAVRRRPPRKGPARSQRRRGGSSS